MTLTPRSPVRAARLGSRHLGLLAARRLVRMPMALITDEFGFSLAPDGWSPLVQALRDVDSDPSAPALDTNFGRFFLDSQVNAVRTLNDLLDLADRPMGFAGLPPFWLGTYPWGGLSADSIGGSGSAFGWAHDQARGVTTAELWGRHRTLWYRPGNRKTIENEYRLTVELYRSIGRRYSPLRARGFPLVTIMNRGDGDRRAVIVDGHHRLAVLAHLGVRFVTVEVEATIDRAEAADWAAVRGGRCTPAQAQRFLDAFFELDGSERFVAVTGGWRSEDDR